MATPANDAVERSVLALCGTLRGRVALEPSLADSADPRAARAPRISVRLASDENEDKAQLAAQLSRRLEAVALLGALATARGFSWRRNAGFWLRLLRGACGALHCERFFDSRVVARQDAEEDARSSRSGMSKSRARAAAAQQVVLGWEKEVWVGSDREDDEPSFELDCSYMELTPQFVSLLRRFLMARAKTHRPGWSFGFVRAMKVLGAVARPRRVIQIDIGLRFNRCQLRPGSLTTLRGVLRDVLERQRQHHGVCATQYRFVPGPSASIANLKQRNDTPTEWEWLVFNVTHIDLSSTRLESNDLAQLADIASSGLLRELALNSVFLNSLTAQVDPSFGHFVIASIRGTQLPSVRQLSLDLNILSEMHLASLFSCIHIGGGGSDPETNQCWSSFHSLSLENSLSLRSSPPWVWLAFGVYHPNSQSSLTHLNLSRNVIRIEDVTAALHLVKHRLTPYDEYFQEKSCRSQNNPSYLCRALLAADTLLYTASNSPSHKKPAQREGSSPLKTNETCAVYVVSRGAKWTRVLVPGYGLVWSRSSRITNCHDNDEPPRKKSRVTKLEMNAMSSGNEGEPVRIPLVLWICMVGKNLRELHVRFNPLEDSDLAAIMTTCRALTHLDVEGCSLTGIQPLVRVNLGNLETLNLAENEIAEQDIADLCRLLRPDRNLTEHDAGENNERRQSKLAVLHLEFNPIQRVGSQSLQRVFKSGNRTLRYLSLDTSQDVDCELQYRLNRFEGEELGVQMISSMHKAALLSVGYNSFPMLLQCDQPVLELISLLAADRIVRHIVWKWGNMSRTY